MECSERNNKIRITTPVRTMWKSPWWTSKIKLFLSLRNLSLSFIFNKLVLDRSHYHNGLLVCTTLGPAIRVSF